MRFRCFSVALMVCGSGLVAGCPLEGLVDGVLSGVADYGGSSWDDTHRVIKDGTYSGIYEWTSEYWQAGESYWDASGEGSSASEFYKGEILKPSGYWIDFGDVDTLDMGTLQISREVHDIEVPDWGYELTYDLTATWSGVPFAGVQYVSYYTNSDGSLSMYDTIELTSLSTHDGGLWEILIESEGTLAQSGRARDWGDGGDSGNPLDDDILDKKFGKARH